MEEKLQALAEYLLPWYRENARQLPWRADNEPYRVWLSEVMLQQTRVEAVRGYFLRFLEVFPTLKQLAEADEQQLMKLWEGLGYYSRARNLQKAAKIIMQEYGGRFPQTYQELRKLPGIGDYTAGAILSICFGQKVPAVDGNVLRICARICAIDTPMEQQKLQLRQALEKGYPDSAGEFTQSLMELGATVCVPNGAPLCEACPVRQLCLARKQGRQRELPVKPAKKARRQEEKTVFLLDCDGCLALQKRPSRGLLAGLWQLPDTVGTLKEQEALTLLSQWGVRPLELLKKSEKTHIFTHITWNMTGYYVRCAEKAPPFVWVQRETLQEQYAVPTAYRQFLGEP